MQRLDMIAAMANSRTKMSSAEKQAIIEVIETKRVQTRPYFENLEREIISKARKGLNVINTYNELADKLEKKTTGWNGFIALIMATWLFTDCVIKLSARRWISREQEESYSEKLRLELYIRLRNKRWEIIRRENWNKLINHINQITNGNPHIGTIAIATGIIALSYLKLKYQIDNFLFFEMSL